MKVKIITVDSKGKELKPTVEVEPGIKKVKLHKQLGFVGVRGLLLKKQKEVKTL